MYFVPVWVLEPVGAVDRAGLAAPFRPRLAFFSFDGEGFPAAFRFLGKANTPRVI